MEFAALLYAFAWLVPQFAYGEVRSKGGLYSLKAKDIDGNPVSLEIYRGKISLVVNVASECGYTDEHYRQMTSLYKELAEDKNEPFTILAFPCNQFGKQEPFEDSSIKEFAKTTYGAPFPMFSKIDVVGNSAHPVYGYITRTHGKEPTWNFWKYLIDENGAVINGWGPRVPVSGIKDDVTDALNKLKAMRHSEF